MATRKSRKPARSGGSTLFGLLIGLILGLAAAVAVAVFVTKAPIPFTDKAHNPQHAALPNAREAPDPNVGLSRRGGTAPPEAARPDTMADDIDRLIASLTQVEQTHVAEPAPVPGATASDTATQTAYYLQAGAFRAAPEAEALKARILMAGLNGFVQSAQADGATLYRVRVGPFRGIDEMNRARTRLGRENIASAVVRP